MHRKPVVGQHSLISRFCVAYMDGFLDASLCSKEAALSSWNVLIILLLLDGELSIFNPWTFWHHFGST